MNHRYLLRREWNKQARDIVHFIMPNPSTADDVFDDPTIRRCIGFAKRWGFSGLVVTNLFAYRATDPADLIALAKKDPALAVGDHDGRSIEYWAEHSEITVAAWGNNVDAGPLRGRDLWIANRLLDHRDLYCIRRTKAGNPAHPVREPYTDEPVKFMYKRVGVEASIGL